MSFLSLFVTLVCLMALISFVSVFVLTRAPVVTYPTSDQSLTYTIDFIFDNVTPEQEIVFQEAALRWRSVISSELPTTAILGGTWCDYTFPRPMVVRNLAIWVRIVPIDGAQGVLGRAGPCAVDGNRFPRFGVIELDSADLGENLEHIAAHEIGHVVGIGTLWQAGVFYDEADYLLDGGNLGHTSLGGEGLAQVETSGGVGTAGAHWDEGVYENELMTGYLGSANTHPLSVLTVGALEDLGYSVRSGEADPYTIPSLRRRLDGVSFNCTQIIPQSGEVHVILKT